MSKEIIQEFLEEVNEKIWADSKRMQEYTKKKCSDVFKSSNGHFVEFEKPSIKKHFCFGHGFCGISTEEDSQRAYDMAQVARTDADYFIEENLAQFKDWEQMLESGETLYLMQQYYKPSRICCVRDEEYFRRYPRDEQKIVEELTLEDVEALKQVVLSEKQKFIKRLNTYLKKYGLSKIHSWTYLVD